MINDNKIVVLTGSNFPFGGAGASFVRLMSLGLQYNNIDVEVVRYWGNRFSSEDKEIKSSNYLFKTPFKNEFLKFFEFFAQILYIPFFLAYRKFVKGDSVLILYCVERAYFILPAIIFCKIFKIKCYRIIAEIWPNYMEAKYWWRIPNILFYNLQLKYIDKYLSGIVVFSKYLYKICVNNGVKDENLILLPHFIDFKKNSKVLSPSSKLFRIGFAGNPSIENGILDLLRAFNILLKEHNLDFELLIVGGISPKINSVIKESNLINKNIIFTGLISNNEVHEKLLTCSTLINPRRKGVLADSGFPTKIGEYFSTKKPVISTKVGDLDSYFQNKRELIFAEPNKPNSLADAILYVYNNKASCKKIAENAYKWGLNNLNYLTNGKKLINFIKR